MVTRNRIQQERKQIKSLLLTTQGELVNLEKLNSCGIDSCSVKVELDVLHAIESQLVSISQCLEEEFK